MITSKQYFDLVKDEWCRSEEQYKPLLNDFIAFAKIYIKEKEHQENLLSEVMQSDEEDGLYQSDSKQLPCEHNYQKQKVKYGVDRDKCSKCGKYKN